MVLSPYYEIIAFGTDVRKLQEDAKVEILANHPGNMIRSVCCYGINWPFGDLSNAVAVGMVNLLQDWATKCEVTLRDPLNPTNHQAYRLEGEHTLWIRKRHMAVLVPLVNSRARVELVARDGPKNSNIQLEWDPNMILLLSEMAIRMKGIGNLKFIYMVYPVD